MNNLNNQEFLQEFKHLKIINANLLTAIPVIHLVGYGLLVLAVLDILAIVLPINLLNPYWLLKTLEQLVEIVPLILIALVFIFYGKNLYRDRQKQYILKIIHCLCFCYGIFLLAIIPLGIIDTAILYQSQTLKVTELVKISTKSNLGALISGMLFIEMWRRNKWVSRNFITSEKISDRS
ncbi:MAG: HpsJ family protein [Pleurocapsa sp.]